MNGQNIREYLPSKTMKLSILLLCLYCTAVGSAHGSKPVTSQDTSANITGNVVNDLTGKPLAHVHIRLVGFAENFPFALYGAMSDAAGRFSIAGVPPSTYVVMLERAGFITVRGPKNGPIARGILGVKTGDRLGDITLRMTPQTIISGHVFNEYGDPLMGIGVTAVPLSPQDAVVSMNSEASATNDRGEIRLVAAPGRYYIKARYSSSTGGAPEIRTDGTIESNYVDTFYPGGTTETDGMPIEVKPGRELRNIDISLARTPVLNISGRVVNIPDGAHTIGLELQSGPNPRRITTGNSGAMSDNGKPDGKFQFGHLSPGFYRFSASCRANEKLLRSQTVEITLTDSNYEDVDLVLAPGSEVTGVVEWAAGTAGNKPPSEKLTVKLRQTGNPFDWQVRPAEIDANGVFKLPDVFADRYRVEVDPMPENTFIKSVQLNGTAVPDGILDFSNGAEGTRVKIILSPNGGQISGRVTDQDGAVLTALVHVLLVPRQDAEQSDLRYSNLDSGGVYKFSGLAPGRYHLFAQGIAGSRGDFFDLIKQHWEETTVIEIKEGQTVSKDLKVIGDEEKNGPAN